MMRTVYKYELPVEDVHDLTLPVGARLVHHAAESQSLLLLWFEVNTTAPTEVRRFHVHGTGHPIFPGSKHLGSVKVDPFVWHIYESSRGIS
jgi:hypothetical protein